MPSTISLTSWFENDVKEYGIQTAVFDYWNYSVFENDVKEYGIQTKKLDDQ